MLDVGDASTLAGRVVYLLGALLRKPQSPLKTNPKPTNVDSANDGALSSPADKGNIDIIAWGQCSFCKTSYFASIFLAFLAFEHLVNLVAILLLDMLLLKSSGGPMKMLY